MGVNFFSKKLFIAILFFATVLTAVLYSSKNDMKDQVLDEIRKSNGKDVFIDLGRFSKERISKLCIQTPYLTRELMEKKIGEKVDGFDEVEGDESFVLWVFKEQKTPVKIKFHRWRELNFGEQQSMNCSLTSLIRIIDSQLYLIEGK